jgi:hypothetical protein
MWLPKVEAAESEVCCTILPSSLHTMVDTIEAKKKEKN